MKLSSIKTVELARKEYKNSLDERLKKTFILNEYL
tara:strand:- start:1485 stop:1589 length:105 start_codon:yes stop_codon:yes gene_type:complete